jgi:hypothetical protein
MVTIFDILNDIITTKKGNLLDDIENEDQFNGYIVSRWLSMYSPVYAQILNDTTNRYYNVFESKKDWYEFLIRILPRGSPGRIHYVKKEKPKDVNNYDDIVKFLAVQFEISRREVENYISQSNIDLTKIKTALK